MKNLFPLRSKTRTRRAAEPQDVFKRFVKTLERLRRAPKFHGVLPQTQAAGEKP